MLFIESISMTFNQVLAGVKAVKHFCKRERQQIMKNIAKEAVINLSGRE